MHLRLVVLYEELAGYIISCLTHLNQHSNIEVHVFRKRINKEAPFQFDFSGIQVYERETFHTHELLEAVREINPTAILCSGWVYKPYLKVCRHFNADIPVILSFDNKWEGSFKQRVACLLSPFYLKRFFNACFVPGDIQKKFALKLGFSNTETGFYCCDTNYFHSIYKDALTSKQRQFPKKLLYVGRYVKHKGIHELWDSFIDLYNDGFNDWELICIGTGPESPVKHKAITHVGFVQPKDLKKYMETTGVFVLPSYIEPWGVVVHEFACAGFPMVCSNQVGASAQFVTKGKNGFTYEPGKANALTDVLRLTLKLNQEQLVQMGNESYELSKEITLGTWSNKMLSLMKVSAQ